MERMVSLLGNQPNLLVHYFLLRRGHEVVVIKGDHHEVLDQVVHLAAMVVEMVSIDTILVLQGKMTTTMRRRRRKLVMSDVVVVWNVRIRTSPRVQRKRTNHVAGVAVTDLVVRRIDIVGGRNLLLGKDGLQDDDDNDDGRELKENSLHLTS